MTNRGTNFSEKSTNGSDSHQTPQRYDRYEVLIESAAEIFRDHGYDGTSLQQIADAVGILKGSLYHYIKSKEDLLFAIIKRNHDHVTAKTHTGGVSQTLLKQFKSSYRGTYTRLSGILPLPRCLFVILDR